MAVVLAWLNARVVDPLLQGQRRPPSERGRAHGALLHELPVRCRRPLRAPARGESALVVVAFSFARCVGRSAAAASGWRIDAVAGNGAAEEQDQREDEGIAEPDTQFQQGRHHKTSKASMLDEAIEYLKPLQLQVHVSKCTSGWLVDVEANLLVHLF
ncbi:uncharacterized protein LOC125532145 isoform X2 [Triticum urartu]|uniref:uncharacterized protein LOC125532145 isoform X2 n=1 Tax=Triticum urartu TaxID=4572 RepID=UPI002042D90D|nr:uncharacterized protein LOC125532145 isoform X2 [Triticum urartu]